MWYNYLKIALRSLRRNRSYSFINILGLAIGITACLLIFLVVQFEMSFDTFHANRKHIYRVVRETSTPEGPIYDRGVQFPVADALRNDFPDLAKVAMIYGLNDNQIDVLEQNKTRKRFKEADGVFFVEPEFFHIFSFAWLAGSASTSLLEPNSVVLTKSTAEKYFGDYRQAMGNLIRLDNQQNRLLKVTGILQDVPANSDFPLKILISYQTLPGKVSDWNSTNSNTQCYVLLPPNSSAVSFTACLVPFARKYLNKANKDNYLLQPLNEIHFDNRFGNFNNRTTSKKTIGALVLIGFFLLVISCINFINLSTAQAFKRSKEIGIRKVLGSHRWQLVNQFLSETFVITCMALLLAGVLAFLTIPYLKEALHLTFEQSAVNKPLLFLFVVLLVPFITISAGFYPALILSNFKPIQALKGKFRASGQQEVTVRKGLVIAQFLVAQVLIICTLAVLNQMHYLQTAPLGFTKESVVTVLIPRDSVGVAGIEPFRNRLLAQPGIKNVSFSLSSPASVRENFWNGFRYDQSAKDEDFNVNLKLADAEYFKTYGIEFVAGRPYLPSDTIREIVVNQTLLKKLGVTEPQQAIGKTITLFGKKYPLVGVVKDFHITSLKEQIVPVLITTVKDLYWQANIQLQTQHLAETMAAIDKNYKSVYPQSLFEYEFVEEAVAGFYKEEKKLVNLFRVFVTIAILISCLGLYGLVSFLAAQKVKEIGIRKILGASLADIIILLSKDFIQLVVIAFIIASPIAWYAMTQWLQNFEYRAPIGWWVFALAGLIAVLIALVTISFQAVKAAVANPVNSLRSE